MKVGIVIITYNISSEIFLLQVAALKKFCKDEFVIEVVDNSSDLELAEQIRYHASHLGLNYVKTFAGGKGSSDSHSFAANFAYQTLKDKYDLLLFLDHDIIPLKSFSAIEILSGGHVAAGIGQGAKKKYLWPGCFFANLSAIDKDIIDFNPSNEFNLDTGGNLYKIVEKYGEESCIFFNESYHQNSDYTGGKYNYFAKINNGMFMHFINSSGWNPVDDNNTRLSSLINIAKQFIDNEEATAEK